MLRNYNKIVLLLLILTFVNHYSLRGTDTQIVSIVIDPSSYISINGNTNVSSFNCYYSNDVIDPVDIKFRKSRNKTEIENAQLAIPVECINCHNSLMNNDLKKLLKASETPYILINIYDFFEKKIMPDEINSHIIGFGTANINVSIAGKTNKYDIEFIDQRKDNEIIITSTLNLRLQNFGLKPPKKIFGAIRLYDNIEIVILLRLFINNNDKNIATQIN